MSERGMTCFATALVLCFVPAAYSQGPVPVGDQFQVNSYTPDNQTSPAVAALADGGFVVLWESNGSSGTDASETSIQARIYTAGGGGGGEFQVNSHTVDHQGYPAVAAMAGGGFVAVWHSNTSGGTDASDKSIQSQRFDADGSSVGEQVQVNTYIPDIQWRPAVAALADGGFVVLWQSLGAPGSSGFSIQGQRYDAGGRPAGGQFEVDTDDGGSFTPAVTALADGGFVVLWHLIDASFSIQGRRFAADGTAGEQFQVNTVANTATSAAVTALADGGFVALWYSSGSPGSDAGTYSIQGRRYGADGTAAGGQFQVNSVAAGDQYFPAVAATADGGFVALWESRPLAPAGPPEGDSGNIGYSIQGQRYAANGARLGGEFRVNTPISELRGEPAVAVLADGSFVALWHAFVSGGTDASAFSVQGRRFVAPRYALAGLGGRCLDVEGSDPSDGTPVNAFPCHGGDNQRWLLELAGLPQEIRGLEHRCLISDLAGGPEQRRLELGACGSPNARWQLVTSGHASPSFLIHTETGLCLGVDHAAPEAVPARLLPCRDDAAQRWRPVAEVCTRDSLGLCLNRERFRVDLAWQSFDGTVGSGQAVPVGGGDSGLLWFFEADNWELLIKVLDGCAINDRLWVFAAATTTVEYTLTVTDTWTGAVAEYFNPLGAAAEAITDTSAFATCDVAFSAADSAPPVEKVTPIRSSAGPALKGDCLPSDTRLCLAGGRFAVEADWRDYAGIVGSGRVVDVGPTLPGTEENDTSGLLWFFDAANWEMLIKVLDACDVNGRFWLLSAATTDVEYTLRVTDTEAGISREYFNPLGSAAPALVDTFDTCP